MTTDTEEPPCPAPGGCPVCKPLPEDGGIVVLRTCIVCGEPIPCGDVMCEECFEEGEAAQ